MGYMIATLIETGATNKVLAFEYGMDNQRFKTEYTEDGTRKYTKYYFDTYEKEVQADGTIRNLNIYLCWRKLGGHIRAKTCR